MGRKRRVGDRGTVVPLSAEGMPANKYDRGYTGVDVILDMGVI